MSGLFSTSINTTTTGCAGESVVCHQIQQMGFRILARNVRERFAEIDIVAEDGNTLVFIEVRTRRTSRLGHPIETITPAKQRNVRRAAEAYLVRKRIANQAIRFDVATIIWEQRLFEYLKNAF